MTTFFTQRFATIKDFIATQQIPNGAYWKGIWSWRFWVDHHFGYQEPYILFFLGLIIIGLALLTLWRVVLKLRNQRGSYDGAIGALATLIIFNVIITLAYLFFRGQALTYLSSRLVVLASIIVNVVWLGYILYQLKRIIPVKERQELEKERFFRYLPKKKEKALSRDK